MRCRKVKAGGAEGIRTPGLISAIDALSQLSYSPSSNGASILKGGRIVKSKRACLSNTRIEDEI